MRGADGIKSGFTNQAGYGFLGSAERDGQRLIMVVAGSPRGRMRNEAARSLIEWGFNSFDSRLLAPAEQRIATASVQEGAARSVGLRAGGPVRIAIPRGKNPQVTLSVRYEGPIRAPISKGERIADLVIAIEGMPESRIPLHAEQDVEVAGPVQRLVNGFAGWIS